MRCSIMSSLKSAEDIAPSRWIECRTVIRTLKVMKGARTLLTRVIASY